MADAAPIKRLDLERPHPPGIILTGCECEECQAKGAAIRATAQRHELREAEKKAKEKSSGKSGN